MQEYDYNREKGALVKEEDSQSMKFLALKTFLEDIKENFPDYEDKIEYFISLIQMRYSEESLLELIDEFLLESNIRKKYLCLRRIISRFKVKCTDEDNDKLAKVIETISDITNQAISLKTSLIPLSIKAIYDAGIKEDSDEEYFLKTRIERAIKDLNDVFRNVDSEIERLNFLFAVLSELQKNEQKTLEAISNTPDGNISSSGTSRGADNLLSQGEAMKQSLMNHILGSNWQLNKNNDIFFMNKITKEKKDKGEQ